MKSNYPTILEEVFKTEGGYVDHPSDPGGATNMGITRRTLARWRKVVPWTKLSKTEVKNLSKAEAEEIYDAYYWDEVQGDLLPSGIDYAVFDYGVNSGPQKAVMELQELLGVARDGVVGNKTLAAVANYRTGIKGLLISYQDERLKFLKSLSTWPVFGKGWSKRIDSVTLFALNMVEPGDVKNDGHNNEQNEEPDSQTDSPVKTNVWLKVLVVLGGLLLTLFNSFRRH